MCTDLHHEVTFGHHLDINYTVQSESIPPSAGALEGCANCRGVPVRIPHSSLVGRVRG